MNIIKYKKMSKGRYKVFLDNNNSIILYEDIILKYNLLIQKELNENILDEIYKENNKYSAYDMSVEYISKKLRCEKEIRNYLYKKSIDNNLINETVIKLKNNGLLNEIEYIKAFTYDKFNLNGYGLKKITKELIKLGFDADLVNEYSIIDEKITEQKLNRLIDKKISSIKNYSGNILKIKLINYFYEQGYEKSIINKILSKKKLSNVESYKKEYDKLYKKYSKKYADYELENIIKQKLYQKGFTK